MALTVTATGIAANWDGPNDGNQGWAVAGGNPVDFTECDLTASVETLYHQNFDHDIAPTDISGSTVHSCSTIDVGTGDNNFPTSAFGFAECHAFVAPSTCNIAHAHINLSHPLIPEDFSETLTTICQEVGHAIGLRHRVSSAESCMWSGATSPHFDSHDHNVIDSHY